MSPTFSRIADPLSKQRLAAMCLRSAENKGKIGTLIRLIKEQEDVSILIDALGVAISSTRGLDDISELETQLAAKSQLLSDLESHFQLVRAELRGIWCADTDKAQKALEQRLVGRTAFDNILPELHKFKIDETLSIAVAIPRRYPSGAVGPIAIVLIDGKIPPIEDAHGPTLGSVAMTRSLHERVQARVDSTEFKECAVRLMRDACTKQGLHDLGAEWNAVSQTGALKIHVLGHKEGKSSTGVPLFQLFAEPTVESPKIAEATRRAVDEMRKGTADGAFDYYTLDRKRKAEEIDDPTSNAEEIDCTKRKAAALDDEAPRRRFLCMLAHCICELECASRVETSKCIAAIEAINGDKSLKKLVIHHFRFGVYCIPEFVSAMREYEPNWFVDLDESIDKPLREALGVTATPITQSEYEECTLSSEFDGFRSSIIEGIKRADSF